jgi:hypothetical protein
VILIAEGERGTIVKRSYTIENEVLKFLEDYSIRIAEVTKDTLTLIVKIDLQSGDVSLKGEIQELKLVQMRV